MNIITSPLTVEQVVEQVGDGTRLTVYVKVTLGEIINLSLEELNEFMEGKILPHNAFDEVSPFLEDVKYSVVACEPGVLNPNEFTSGSILLEVSGDVEIYGH